MLGVYDPACLVSLSGLAAAVAAMILAVRGTFELAMVGLIIAGIADLFDGVVARRLKRGRFEKEFGVQLDTTVDVFAFVATPVVIVLNSVAVSWAGALGAAWFVTAGVVRLAHFNTLTVRETEPVTHHQGLPVTYTALIFPLLFLVRGTMTEEHFQLLLVAALVAVGFLFVINVPVPKPRGMFYVILPLLAVCLTVYWVGRYLNWFGTV